MAEQKRGVNEGIANRARYVYTAFVLLVLVLGVRLIYVQLDPWVGTNLQNMVDRHIVKRSKVKAHRGTIFARDGRILATSITQKEIWLDFGSSALSDRNKFMADAQKLSYHLANYFGDKSAMEYYSELVDNHSKAHTYSYEEKKIPYSKWMFWKGGKTKEVKRVVKVESRPRSRKLFRAVDLNEREELRRYPILNKGEDVTYNTTNVEHRIYPQGDIALRTIGRNDVERGRCYGIESALDDTLSGKDGVQYWKTIWPGNNVRIDRRNNIAAEDGYDIVTTLDVDVQDVADKALRDQLIEENAIWGTTVVMECATGDILAMANLGRNSKGEIHERQNYAIGVPVNPGSTFKLISSMALLENGFSTSRRYHTGLKSTVRVGGSVGADIVDDHEIAEENEGMADMRTAFAHSSNVYFTKAVFDYFRDSTYVFSDFCRKLHLHETVGLEYLGARSGVVPDLHRRHSSRYNALVNMAYGYNLDITPLHTLAIYNAVINNGKMVTPRLIKRLERDGECVKEIAPSVLEEYVCSPRTAQILRSFMEDASSVGTASGYFGEDVCSFRTGSKTGTAQVETTINSVKYERKDGYYYGSMITYLPAENPRYVLITAIFTKNRRDGSAYYGAGLAGPVQKRVSTFLHNRDKEYTMQLASNRYYPREIKWGSVEDMRTVAERYAKEYTAPDREGWGSSYMMGRDKVSISRMDTPIEIVPSVVGMGLNDALYLLERCGLTVEVVGEGRVVRQSVRIGTVAEVGRIVKIELE